MDYTTVLKKLEEQGIAIRVASPKLVMEEAPESYKNVTDVVNTCHAAGISKKTLKLVPIAVIKGWFLSFSWFENVNLKIRVVGVNYLFMAGSFGAGDDPIELMYFLWFYWK